VSWNIHFGNMPNKQDTNVEYWFREWQGRLVIDARIKNNDCLWLCRTIKTQSMDTSKEVGSAIRDLEAFRCSKNISELEPVYCKEGHYLDLIECGNTSKKQCNACYLVEINKEEDARIEQNEKRAREARQNKKQLGCSVYVMQCMNFTKIGIAEDVNKRRSSIQTSHFTEVAVVHKKKYKTRSIARKVESDLHKEYRDFRKKGEWFDLDGVKVREVVNKL